MEQLIQFRSVIESFDNDEFNLFTQQLFKIYDKRTLLIKSLFFMLLNESKHNNYNGIQQINKICKSITDLRRKKLKLKIKHIKPTNHDSKSDANYLNKLASPIISEIASYLKTAEQPQFMQCNRYIFISCSSTPSTIQQLSSKTWLNKFCRNYGVQFAQYQISKLSKFRMTKQITFDGLKIMCSKYFGDNGNLWKWNNLNLLNLDFYWIYDKQEVKRSNYLMNILKNIEIKHLVLKTIYFGYSEEIDFEFQKKSFLALLSANKKLEFLEIECVRSFNGNNNTDCFFDDDILKQTLSTLKGLALSVLSRPTISDQFVSCLNKQIESLHLSHTNNRMSLSSNNDVHYTNLKELCMVQTDYILTSNILRTAHSLKRIYWEFGIQILQNQMNTEQQEMIFKHVLSELIELEYLAIKTVFDSEIFERIKIGFGACLKKKRNIKLSIEFDDKLDAHSLKYIEENIEAMVDVINKSVIKNFLFSLKITINTHDEFESIDSKLKEMMSLYSIQTITETIDNENKHIFITNKENTMCGYDEKWMFKCNACR